MTRDDIQALMKGIAPVVRDLVRQEVKDQLGAQSERMAHIIEQRLLGSDNTVHRSMGDAAAQRAVEGL